MPAFRSQGSCFGRSLLNPCIGGSGLNRCSRGPLKGLHSGFLGRGFIISWYCYSDDIHCCIQCIVCSDYLFSSGEAHSDPYTSDRPSYMYIYIYTYIHIYIGPSSGPGLGLKCRDPQHKASPSLLAPRQPGAEKEWFAAQKEKIMAQLQAP